MMTIGSIHQGAFVFVDSPCGQSCGSYGVRIEDIRAGQRLSRADIERMLEQEAEIRSRNAARELDINIEAVRRLRRRKEGGDGE